MSAGCSGFIVSSTRVFLRRGLTITAFSSSSLTSGSQLIIISFIAR